MTGSLALFRYALRLYDKLETFAKKIKLDNTFFMVEIRGPDDKMVTARAGIVELIAKFFELKSVYVYAPESEKSSEYEHLKRERKVILSRLETLITNLLNVYYIEIKDILDIDPIIKSLKDALMTKLNKILEI